MKTTKEMPKSGQFVAVWVVDRELKVASYKYKENANRGVFYYNVEHQSWDRCSSPEDVEDFLQAQKNITFITSLTENNTQGGIRLELDDRWKWLAKDGSGDWDWWLYTDRPSLKGRNNWGGTGDCEKVRPLFKNLPDYTPENSLHEILKGGVIRPWREPFTPVVGEFYEFCDDPEFNKDDCIYGFLQEITASREFPFRDHLGDTYAYCRKPQHIQLKEG